MKKPGEFKKQQKKHQNIQHNRDQLKLLKDKVVEFVELFVLDPDGFKKITIKAFPEVPYNVDGLERRDVVYLQRRKNKTKLRTGELVSKDAYPRCYVFDGGFIEWDDCFGLITQAEMLKPKEDVEND
jgi:hypothetical protein